MHVLIHGETKESRGPRLDLRTATADLETFVAEPLLSARS